MSDSQKMVEMIMDFQEIGSRIESIRHNLLPAARNADDEETVKLRSLQRDLVGEFASMVRAMAKYANHEDDDEAHEFPSMVNKFRSRCSAALRVRKVRVRRSRRRSRRLA